MWVSPGYRADVMVKMPDGQADALPRRGARPSDLLGSVIAIVDVDPSAGEPTEVNVPAEADVAALAPPTTRGPAAVDGRDDGGELRFGGDRSPESGAPRAHAGRASRPISTAMWRSCRVTRESTRTRSIRTRRCASARIPNISCRRFDERRARGYRSDRVMTAGTSERWEIRAFDGHPFHIHINPFLVCPNKSNKEPNFAHWRDTMWVQTEDGPRDVIMNPRRFTGTVRAALPQAEPRGRRDDGARGDLRPGR